MRPKCAAVKLIDFLLVLTLLMFLSPQSGVKATPVTSAVVINEIDYDQPGTDSAEFIEIMNNSVDSINLDTYALKMVNGAVLGAPEYRYVDLPDVVLAAGDYYVVCANPATTLDCDLDASPDTDFIQNGAPDAVALLLSGEIIDTVSYEGDTEAPYTEGSGAGLVDNAATASMGIARCPDGTDTDQNNVDFAYRLITPGAVNDCPTEPPPIGACGDPATPIHTVQGSGSASPLLGEQHTLEGVVVGDFQNTASGLSGFFLQEEDGEADADPLTSEGIFVYDNGFGIPVNLGDVVRVRGQVIEFFDKTELSNVIGKLACSTGASVTPTVVSLPVSNLDDWERYEGMLIDIPQTLYATENYNLGRYGEVELSVVSRLFSPTQIAAPGAAAQAVQDLNDRSRIQLDDGSNVQNPMPLPPYLGLNNTLRAGDTLDGLTGVLGYSFDSYEVHPTQAISFTRVNNRPVPPPTLAGRLKVASFNVLNYFTTLDTGLPICGPSGGLDCRGADSVAEFNRQRDKILNALTTLDPDIAGLIELENNATTAIQDLVDGLNDIAGPGTYAFIDTGTIGTDAIKLALIYKPGKVTPVGDYAILDSSVDPTFLDTRNRPSLAQTFETPLGGRFTVVVNHFKSKGSACSGDPDTGDGQGNCNVTRTAAAAALTSWLAGDPTDSGDDDFLIIGDLNSYAMEDPLTEIKDAGYTSLSETYLDETDAYSYVFEGATGELDHALASASLADQVVDAAIWHINADEPSALDYNDYNQPLLYQPDAFRSSDHDPLVIYLDPVPPWEIWLPVVFSGSQGR